MKKFNNYKELMDFNKGLAEELIDTVGTGEWQDNEMYLYEDLGELAEYELTEGWYANMDIDKDWNGAPNPMDYIDLNRLGEALSENWDSSVYFEADNGAVLSTNYGW